MNIAVIFAGGTGQRMGNVDKPKQFMDIGGKPIIIHTLEIFERHTNIDKIIVVCLKEWIQYLENLLKQYKIEKVDKIVPGGNTGQMSIFNGLQAAIELYPKNSVVLIHDGVRPFISNELIDENIRSVLSNGSAISCVLTTETFMIIDQSSNIKNIPTRKNSLIAKAPQSFYLKNIYDAHIKAQSDGKYDFIDSCTLMYYYNYPLKTILTDYDNIKITTPKDIALAEAIYKRRLKDR